jgi:hypothetical protein
MRRFVVLLLALVGCKGPERIVGPMGRDGEQGSRGDVGPAGVEGNAGERGPPGDVGQTGLPGKDAVTSGSRVKAQWFMGADGSRQFRGWLDTATGEPCTYVMATDGAYRCLPPSVPSITWSVVYADDACTQPVLAEFPGNGMPQTPVQYARISGYEADRYVKSGGAIPTPAELWIAGAGTCAQDPAKLDAFFYFLMTELAPSFFPAASVTTDP